LGSRASGNVREVINYRLAGTGAQYRRSFEPGCAALCGKRLFGERRLRPFQVRGDLSVAAGRHFGEVAINRLTRIDPQLHPEVPSSLVVGGSERLAIVKFDDLAQLKGQLGPLLVPFPAAARSGTIDSRPLWFTCWSNIIKLLNTPIIAAR
jgi:hypothetical protein